MEWLTILLTGLLSGVTPTGFVLDTVVEQNLRSRLPGSEEIIVRIDSTPTHQVLSGRADRVRLATRGLQLTPNIRVAVLEVDTDPISISISQLQRGVALRQSLRQPLQGGVRLVLDEDDLNATLASEQFRDRLNEAASRIAGQVPGSGTNYEVEQVTVDFLETGRLQLNAQVRSDNAQLQIRVETALTVEQGAVLGFEAVEVFLNDESMGSFINQIVERNLNGRFDLRQLADQGIIARLLQLEVTPDELRLAAFVHLAPASPTATP